MADSEQLNRFLNLPHWRYPSSLPGVTGLYLNTLFRVLAIGLTGIFIPVFIYKTSGAWTSVFYYYAIYIIATIASILPASIIINKKGPDFSVAIAAVTDFLALICLIKSEGVFGQSLILAAMLAGIAVSLHWIPYHLAFSWESTRRLSEQIAKNAIFSRIAAASAPLIGGIIATSFGFSTLYLVSGFILLVSVIPIFLDRYNERGQRTSLLQIKRTFKNKRLAPLWQGYFGAGVESAIYAVFWPIFLYECFRNLEQIGLLSTISLLCSLLVIHSLSKAKNEKGRKYFQAGVFASIPNWIIRGFTFSFFPLIILDLIYQISTLYIWLPVEAITYRWGRKRGKSFFAVRSFMINTGFLISLAAGIIFVNLNYGWFFIFGLAVVGLSLTLRFHHGFKKNIGTPHRA